MFLLLFKFFRHTVFPIIILFLFISCAQDYAQISSSNGRRAVLDEARNHLTAGYCDQAITVLQSLVNSQYVDKEAYYVYSSAYACKGGMNFVASMLSLKDLQGSDMWTPLIKANYSSSSSDGKTASLLTSADILLRTASPAGSVHAYSRDAEANAYMIFVQLNVIATVIAPLGAASATTGKKTTSLCTSCGAAVQCYVATAIAIINDSLAYVNSGSALSKVSTVMSAACSGSTCPQERSYSNCLADTATQTLGQNVINVIDSQWSQ